MRKLLLAFCAFAMICSAGAQWKPAGDKIKTDWAEKVDPRNVLPEYPRPGMERADWQNLNGEWEYAILPKGQAEPTSFDGNILVPFAVESSLSGVQKEVGEKNYGALLMERKRYLVELRRRGLESGRVRE